jgi:glycosyltransferase involved in cell wall biosynthesis
VKVAKDFILFNFAVIHCFISDEENFIWGCILKKILGNNVVDNNMTVIIPFLNEGKEVFNTVKNIRESSSYDFDIILINNESSDGFDYKQIAIEFNTQYIEHKERQGVAFSRDEGVDLCSSEYFLLLDAHMRVFQNDWLAILVDELEKDSRALFCCKNIVLNENGEISSDASNTSGYGAYIDFENLSINWIAKDYCPDELIVDFLCSWTMTIQI